MAASRPKNHCDHNRRSPLERTLPLDSPKASAPCPCADHRAAANHDARAITDESSESVPWSGWFAGPKAENGEWFGQTVGRVVQDYHSWRRNYFPEDGVVVNSSDRDAVAQFRDSFDDRMLELLARLKGDFPFHSPRYAAHMVAEQSLPAIAGYFAAMLYNPNNVATDAAPVTIRLEIEAAQMIARMLGYDDTSWAHLTSGGTIANIEALWVARSTRFLPLALAEVRAQLNLPRLDWPADPHGLLRISPAAAISALDQTIEQARELGDGEVARIHDLLLKSRFNPTTRGIARVTAEVKSHGVLLVPETHHYSLDKAADVLGLGHDALIRIPVDRDFRMRVDALEEVLDQTDRDRSHVIAVVAVAGSTEEGAVDPIDQIAAMRDARESAGRGSFWLHADAAYGGYLRTITIPARIGLGRPTTRTRIGGKAIELPLQLPVTGTCNALEAFPRCDSITIDPHKLGYIPYPAGAICFKFGSVRHLAATHPPYIQGPARDLHGGPATESIGKFILEGSKPGAAAAAVWLSHSLIPLDSTGHGRLLKETVRNACELHALLTAWPDHTDGTTVRAVFPCSPGSNIACWTFAPKRKGASLAEINAANRRIYSQFTLPEGHRVYGQSFFVSHTELRASHYRDDSVREFLDALGVTSEEYAHDGVFVLRCVLMNPWYSQAKRRERYYLSELTAHLFEAAELAFKTPVQRTIAP